MKNTAKIELFKKLRNSLGADVSENLRAAFDAAITELEADENEHTIEEAIATIKERLGQLASIEQVVEIENNFKKLLESGKGKGFQNEYLKTKQAVKDFLNCIQNNPKHLVEGAWKAKLIENGVTDNDGVFLPEAVLVKITDGLKRSRIWDVLNHTNLKKIKVGYNYRPEQGPKEGGNTSRPHKYVAGENKQIQPIEVVRRDIEAEAIYKLVEIDYETAKNCENDFDLFNYITDELARAMAAELERCVLVGDSRSANPITKIKSIKNDPWTTAATYTEENIIDGVMQAIAGLSSDVRVVVAASKQTILKMRRTVYGQGGTPVYLSLEELANRLGVAEVVAVQGNYMGDNIAIFDADAYLTVGSENETIYGYSMLTNMHQYELIKMAGGAMSTRWAAAWVTKTQTANQPANA